MGTVARCGQKHPEEGTTLLECLAVSLQDGKAVLKASDLTVPVHQVGAEPVVVDKGRSKSSEESPPA